MQNITGFIDLPDLAELMGGKVIFGIEEPEIYLYPQAQRVLYKTLIKLSDASQIFYTTHNPNFVDARRPDDICLLRKSCDGTYILSKNTYFNALTAEKKSHRIYTLFNNERNEIFSPRKLFWLRVIQISINYNFM